MARSPSMDLGHRTSEPAQNHVPYRTPNITRSDGPYHFHDQYQSLSPTSRTRVIEQARVELMEMVRNMPETYYELSLRDLVEKTSTTQEDGVSWEARNSDPEDEKAMIRTGSAKKRQSSGKAQMVRIGSIGNNKGEGFLLKMVFPGSSLGSKQKHRNGSALARNGSSKVSPRPSLSDGPSDGALDRDLWKKFSAPGKGDHGILGFVPRGIKSNNRKNDRNGRKKASIGCWPFFQKKKIASLK